MPHPGICFQQQLVAGAAALACAAAAAALLLTGRALFEGALTVVRRAAVGGKRHNRPNAAGILAAAGRATGLRLISHRALDCEFFLALATAIVVAWHRQPLVRTLACSYTQSGSGAKDVLSPDSGLTATAP